MPVGRACEFRATAEAKPSDIAWIAGWTPLGPAEVNVHPAPAPATGTVVISARPSTRDLRAGGWIICVLSSWVSCEFHNPMAMYLDDAACGDDCSSGVSGKRFAEGRSFKVAAFARYRN